MVISRSRPLLLPLLLCAAMHTLEVTPGLHADLPCDGAPKLTYNIYLPKAYADKTEARFPALFISSPGGNPSTRTYEPWADRQGVVLVTINDSRNGSWEPILAAQKAVTATVFANYRIHHCLRFAVGMSGGAWASATLAARFGDAWAGVLMNCNSQRGAPVRKPLCCAYITGSKDTTYAPMNVRTDYEAAKAAGCPARYLERPTMGHDWGSQADQTAMLDWMLEVQRLSHPRLTANEVKDAQELLRTRISELTAEPDPAKRADGTDTLLQVDQVAASKDGQTLRTLWCLARIALAEATAEPVARYRIYESVTGSNRISALPAAERKALTTRMTESRKDPTVKADVDSRAALADARQAEAKAGNTKGRLKDVLAAYTAITKRWPDTEAGKEAIDAAAYVMGKLR